MLAKSLIQQLIPKRFIEGIIPSRFLETAAEQQPLLSRHDILDLARRIELDTGQNQPHPEVAHRLYGDNRSVYRGYGLDFEESRNYQSGDEIRFMNWRLTARMGEPYMKVFREERRPGVFIMVDRRTSMRFGTRVRLKATQAARAATLTAFKARQHHTTIGGVMLEPNPLWLHDAMGDSGSYALAFAAARPCPPISRPDSNNDEAPGLGHILRLLSAMLVSGSNVYLISDFTDLSQSDYPVLLQLASEHAISAIHISDPAELNLPTAGNLQLFEQHDAEGISCDTDAKNVQNLYQLSAQQYLKSREAILRSTGCLYSRLSTDTDAIETEIAFHE